ncbi:hypothetical protein MT418_003620 [Batrachochytrium dendrobatidis]
MDWSAQNVVAMSLAPGSTVRFGSASQSYTNSRTSGYELLLWNPIDYKVQHADKTAVQYIGAVAFTNSTEIRSTHGINRIHTVKWNPTGYYLATIDSNGSVGIWSHHKSACTLEHAYDTNVDQSVIAFAWCDAQSKCQPTYPETTNTISSHELQPFESAAVFKHSTVIGSTSVFGAFSFMTLTELLELNLHCYSSEHVMVHHKIKLDVSGMTGACTAATIHPVAQNCFRIFIKHSSPGVVYAVDIELNLPSGKIVVMSSTCVQINPTGDVVMFHAIDKNRLAVVCREPSTNGSSRHVLSVWEQFTAETFLDTKQEWKPLSKWIYSNTKPTALCHLNSISGNFADQIIVVGTSSGKIEYRDASTLALLNNTHKLLFHNIDISENDSSLLENDTAVSLKPDLNELQKQSESVQLDMFFNDMDALDNSLAVPAENLQNQIGFDANQGLDMGLNEIFGTMPNVALDPLNQLTETLDGTDDTAHLFSIAFYASPNGLHLLTQKSSLQISANPTTSHINSLMFVTGPLKLNDISSTTVQDLFRPLPLAHSIAHAIADGIFAAMIDGQCCSDYLVLLKELAQNEWAKTESYRTALLQRLHFAYMSYFSVNLGVASIYPLSESGCQATADTLVGIQLAIQRIFVPNSFAFRNTGAMMRLRFIISIFQASSMGANLSSDNSDALYLNSVCFTSASTQHTQITLNKETLHYLVPHALWILDYCAFLARSLYIQSTAIKPAPDAESSKTSLLGLVHAMALMHQPSRRALILGLFYIKVLKHNLSQTLLGLSFPKNRQTMRSTFLLGYVRSVENLLTVRRINIDSFATFLIEFDQAAERGFSLHSESSLAAECLALFIGSGSATIHHSLIPQLQTLFNSHIKDICQWPEGTAFPSHIAKLKESSGNDKSEQHSLLTLFIPGQIDRLELDPIDYLPKASKCLIPLSSTTSQRAAATHKRETPNEKEFVLLPYIDTITGQHLRFSTSVKQCLMCCRFSTCDYTGPKMLANLLEGTKNTSCMVLIDGISKIPTWSGLYGGCCLCGGKWRNVS